MATSAQITELVAQVGRSLYGEHYKSALAAALAVSADRVDDWSKGRGNQPPVGVWSDIGRLLKARSSSIPRLRKAVQALVNAAGLRATLVDKQGTHIVTHAVDGLHFRGTLEQCQDYVAKESARALQAAMDMADLDTWELAERVASEACQLASEVARRGLAESPFDEANFSRVLSLAFYSIGTGDHDAMHGSLAMIDGLRQRLPKAAHPPRRAATIRAG